MPWAVICVGLGRTAGGGVAFLGYQGQSRGDREESRAGAKLPPRRAEQGLAADCLQVRRESCQYGVVCMAWVIRSASPHLHRASLGTGRCAACRKVPGPGSRTRVAGERKDAMGNMVNPRKPREGKRAKAAERL
jgi:hypothetical protein